MVYKAFGERLLNYCCFHDRILKDVEVIKRKCDLKDCYFYLIATCEEIKYLRIVFKRNEFKREYQQRREDMPALKI